MREMKDSGVAWIGEIPKDWKLERLQWHLEEIKDSNKTGKSKQVLSLTNSRGVIPYEEKGAQGNVAKEDYSQYKLAYPGTIVANSMNILIGSVGICNYFGCVSPVYYVFKPKENENIDFINYLFQMEQFQKDLRRYANGIMEIRLRVSADGILKRELAFPSIEEQEKIVAYLNSNSSKVDSIIANNESQIEKLKQYKQSLISEVVTKGLDPTVLMKDSGVEWVKEIPACWEMLYPKTLFKQSKEKARPDDIQLTSSQQLGIIEQEKYMELTGSRVVVVEKDFDILKHVDSGDFVISMRSFQGGIEYSNVSGCISSAYVMLKPNLKKIYPRYYRWLLKSSLYINSIRSTSNLVRDGQAMRYANFIQIWLPCPPIAEQETIADYLDKKCTQIDRLIAIKQAKIEKLNQYKKSLIYEYVTGKKEVVPTNV